jgi:sulfate adenylyltransferase subunit 1 (EFTu-like GTPase family)
MNAVPAVTTRPDDDIDRHRVRVLVRQHHLTEAQARLVADLVWRLK